MALCILLKMHIPPEGKFPNTYTVLKPKTETLPILPS